MRWGLLAVVCSLFLNAWASADVKLVKVFITGKSSVAAGKKINLIGSAEYYYPPDKDRWTSQTSRETNYPGKFESKWSSSNKSIATVSSSGVVTGKKAGTVTIKYTYRHYNETKSASKKITVTKEFSGLSISGGDKKVLVGKSLTFNAVAKYTDGSTAKVKAAWSTSDKKIATVSSGKVTGKKAGTVTITVSYKEGGVTKKASKKITVAKQLKSLTVSGAKSVAVGKGVTLSSKAKYTDDSEALVVSTWSTSNKAVATVNAAGVVTGKKAGTATIKATYSYGGVTKSVTCKITVK